MTTTASSGRRIAAVALCYIENHPTTLPKLIMYFAVETREAIGRFAHYNITKGFRSTFICP
jgi:hypothetical protein